MSVHVSGVYVLWLCSVYSCMSGLSVFLYGFLYGRCGVRGSACTPRLRFALSLPCTCWYFRHRWGFFGFCGEGCGDEPSARRHASIRMPACMLSVCFLGFRHVCMCYCVLHARPSPWEICRRVPGCISDRRHGFMALLCGSGAGRGGVSGDNLYVWTRAWECVCVCVSWICMYVSSKP
jgi:hypothetical protein